MVIEGHLSDFPLGELLFFLSSKNRSGWLTLWNEQITIDFQLRNGRVIAARSSEIDGRLGQRLIALGALTPAQLERALAEQARRDDRPPLGQLLCELDVVPEPVVRRALQQQLAECIFRFLIMPGGRFTFERGLPDVRGVQVDLSTEREVLAAIQRADEWTMAHVMRAPLRLAPDLTSDAFEPIIATDWPIVDALMDGAASLDDVIRRSGLTREVAAEGLLRLVAHGIVYPDVHRAAESDPVPAA